MKANLSVAYRLRAVLPVWNDRIAPLFDVARSLRLVELESGRVIRREDVMMPDVPAASKAIRLVEMGTQVLVCGAISDSLRAMIMAHGIEVVPFRAGDISELEQALVSGSLDNPAYAMPGWRKRARVGSVRSATSTALPELVGAGTRGRAAEVWGRMEKEH